MNIFVLVWNYLVAKPLNTALNILLLALGIAVITVLLLASSQLEEKISQNSKGIDLVVGAKGSPLQLILCNIFHIDFPTGNINLAEAERIAKNRLVKSAIPLALGDSYQNFRIVGTSQAYPEQYEATIKEGKWWSSTLEVTVGANVAKKLSLSIGDQFESAHGLMEGGSMHESDPFMVVGILNPTNSVIDNLILCNVETIWEVHHEEGEGEEHVGHDHDSVSNPSLLVSSVEAGDSTKEITSMLIKYRSPMGALQLPRIVNGQSSMQAASPAFETARLFSILGVGVDVLMGFAYILIFISALSIFIALYNSLKERKYDLAIMRAMGASRLKLFTSIVLEGGTMTFLGSILGLLLGHGVLVLLSNVVEDAQRAGFDGFIFYPQEWIILGASLLLGMVCALLPAIQAYRTDISKVLAGN